LGVPPAGRWLATARKKIRKALSSSRLLKNSEILQRSSE
jgi:hypothetical protein